MRQVDLEKFKVGMTQRISTAILVDKVEATMDALAKRVTLEVQGFLWGRNVARYIWERPADWWQAFRERWFPAWVLKRWPVKVHREVVDVRAYWPSVKTLIPNHYPRLVLGVNDQPMGVWGDQEEIRLLAYGDLDAEAYYRALAERFTLKPEKVGG